MNTTFEIAGASVLGQAHAAAGRNNQDAFAWVTTENGIVAVVCDGCGSGAHSEVGAQIGARLVAQAAARRLETGLEPADWLASMNGEILASMDRIVADMAGAASSSPLRLENLSGGAMSHRRIVGEYWLFTIVGVVVGLRQTVLFSLGDGLVVVNGQLRALGPFPNNEPPYLAYALASVFHESARSETCFQILSTLPTEQVNTVLLATDGAMDIDMPTVSHPSPTDLSNSIPADGARFARFWVDDAVFRNPDMLRRRLTVMGRELPGGRFSDDTSMVVLRRRRLPS